MIDINLDEDDLTRILATAKNRQQNKDKNGVVDRAYKLKNQKGFALHFIGAIGEYAVCKYLGTKFDDEIYVGSDKGYDTEFHGTKLEVKTRKYFNPKKSNLILNPECHDRKTADVYVLASIRDPAKVCIEGCISWKKFDEQKIIGDYGAGKRYFVEPKSLTSIEVVRNHFLSI